MPQGPKRQHPSRRPIAAMPRSIRRRVVRETLSTMSENQRLALTLYHYEKLGPVGIAEALRISRGEADRLLVDGRARLNHALDRHERSGDVG